MDHADVQRDSRSSQIDRVQLFRLAGEFENRTHALFRFEARVRGFSLNLDREDAGSLAAGLHATTGRGRLHYKRATHGLRFRGLLDERPSRQTPDLFITRQHQCHAICGLCLQLDERSQHFDREGAVCFHVEDAWPINLSCFATPRTFTQRSARVDRVRMSDHQNLVPASLLKSSDDEMLSEVRHVHTLNRIDTREFTCSVDEKINHRTTAFHVARRRLDFNQRLDKRLDLGLPRLQRSENVTCEWSTHLIVSLRTVSASLRFRLMLKPMPGASGTLIVPRALTVTGGSMMSSSQ